jgi:hypothetical protein
MAVGRREAVLLALRARLFGETMAGWADCPACGVRAEFALRVGDLLGSAREPGGDEGEELVVRAEGYEIHARLPNGDDLVAVAEAAGEDPRRMLFERCVSRAVDLVHGLPVPASRLSEQALDALSHRLAEADPLADVRLNLACPSCPQRWGMALDAAGFLWAEVDAWARRLLLDVHALASAYGWDEPTVLALSPWRRACYLDMVRA